MNKIRMDWPDISVVTESTKGVQNSNVEMTRNPESGIVRPAVLKQIHQHKESGRLDNRLRWIPVQMHRLKLAHQHTSCCYGTYSYVGEHAMNPDSKPIF